MFVYRGDVVNSALKMAGAEIGLFTNKSEVSHRRNRYDDLPIPISCECFGTRHSYCSSTMNGKRAKVGKPTATASNASGPQVAVRPSPRLPTPGPSAHPFPT